MEGFVMARKRLPEKDMLSVIHNFALDHGLEEFLGGFSLEQRLAGLKPEDRLAGLKPEDRLAGLKPKDRLAGLKSEELAQLREALDRLIQNGETNGKKQRRKPRAPSA
jgi:hypothetical protein